jgi:hypothetical protein
MKEMIGQSHGIEQQQSHSQIKQGDVPRIAYRKDEQQSIVRQAAIEDVSKKKQQKL